MASCLSTLHNLTVRSSPPEAMNEPLGEKRADWTQLVCPANEWRNFRSGSDVNLTSLSSAAESTKRSSREMSQARTGLKCIFSNAGVCLPAWLLQTATVASIDEDTTNEVDAATHVTAARCAEAVLADEVKRPDENLPMLRSSDNLSSHGHCGTSAEPHVMIARERAEQL
eukprot:CAMPEP_0115308414 /NCGR_PEP_ID=MMETSP0270-20121206/73687_1 /TAXON_ID=71861 /ORGANISM="Scrippsiella trochoidea, Strain CCMP3099" /LENGTH=169 /DNA_ID=CAMNT_0002726973 /DNA_START=400 /DNA_END=907 /DNA_ORIENTATION=+